MSTELRRISRWASGVLTRRGMLGVLVAAVLLVPSLEVPATAEPAALTTTFARVGVQKDATRRQVRRFQLHVATFNISGLLNETEGRQHLPWAKRRAKVAGQLLGQRWAGSPGPAADVIALQEANTSRRLAHRRTQYTDLVYRINLAAPTGHHYRAVRPSLHLNATRIAYDASRLTLVRAGALRWRAQETKVDGDRMLAWAVFRTRATHERFFFASAHLETASRSVRLRQWKQLVSAVPRLAHSLPIVLGGDFNSTRNNRHDAARKMLSRMYRAGIGDSLGQRGPGYLTVHQLRAKRASGAVWNSVNGFRSHLRRFEHPGWVGLDVDYIFASNRLGVLGWQLVSDHARHSSRLLGVIPSDHNLLRATILLTSRR